MTNEDKKYVRTVIDHFVSYYKLSLRPYNKAYRIWFERGLYSEIILDFLRTLHIPANVRLIKENTRTSQFPHRVGFIDIPKNPILLFSSENFKKFRFRISVDHGQYNTFEDFICTLIHELSHLVLYSTMNKYRESEVATDLFVMAFGLYEERYSVHKRMIDSKGYITLEQTNYAYQYIQLKRKVSNSTGLKKIVNTIRLQLSS